MLNIKIYEKKKKAFLIIYSLNTSRYDETLKFSYVHVNKLTEQNLNHFNEYILFDFTRDEELIDFMIYKYSLQKLLFFSIFIF